MKFVREFLQNSCEIAQHITLQRSRIDYKMIFTSQLVFTTEKEEFRIAAHIYHALRK